MIIHKIEQDNYCFIIQQTINKTLFIVRKTVVAQRFARFWTNLGNLRILQDICYVQVMDNNGFLTIYGHRTSLLNKKYQYECHKTCDRLLTLKPNALTTNYDCGILPGTTITLLNCTVQLPCPPDRVVTITSPLPCGALPVRAIILLADL